MSRATTNPVYKIFEAVVAAKAHWDKKKILEDNDCLALRRLCRIIADDKIKFLIPEGAPPFKPLSEEGASLALYPRIRELYMFINDDRPASKNMKPLARQQRFIELLENIHPKDAEWLIRIKDKDMPKGITPALLERAFPGLLNVAL